MNNIIQGHVLDILPTLQADSVDCVVTSPPYWGLRDYKCDGQIGLEKTPEEYVLVMVQVFREVRRVLKPTGVCFVNLGDSYSGSMKGSGGNDPERSCKQVTNPGSYFGEQVDKARKFDSGLKPKDLCGIPWRVAFSLQADGWWLRSDIIWNKPNPMPESVTDRPTKAHEYIFLLTKSARYFWNQEAVREGATNRPSGNKEPKENHQEGRSGFWTSIPYQGGPLRNIRSVWTAKPNLWQLRSDLSASDRAYVLGELLKRGSLGNTHDSESEQNE